MLRGGGGGGGCDVDDIIEGWFVHGMRNGWLKMMRWGCGRETVVRWVAWWRRYGEALWRGVMERDVGC